MADLTLVIGDRNRSSWSLRAWLLLRQLGLEFEEVVVPMGRADTAEQILRHSPSGKLPILIAGTVRVWDSLAIAETLAEHFTGLWPGAAEARAVARSISAEVHGGFRDQQVFLPMDFTTRFSPPGRMLAPVAADLRRIVDIWTTCRTRYGEGGPFLFGTFTIPDAMFAPICAALTTHSLPLDDLCRAYVSHMMELPAMQEWAAAARGDPGRRPAPAASPTSGAKLFQEPASPPPRGTPFPPPPAPPVPPVIEPPAAVVPPRAAPASFIPPPRPVPVVTPRPPAATLAVPPPPPAQPEPEIAEEPPLELTELAPDEEDAGPPAPGLPGVVPTQAYAEPEEEPGEAPRRLVRPPGGTGLFRWRQPRPPVPEQPAAAPARRPAPPPPAPRPEPKPVQAADTTPRQPASAPQPTPSPPAVEQAQALPASGRPLLRPGTIKPIGDGIRRRR